MSEGPKLQEAQPGDPPGKIVELLLKLSDNDDDMPTVEVRREGESQRTNVGEWPAVGPALRLEAANTPDVSFLVFGAVEFPLEWDGDENTMPQQDYEETELEVALEDWCLESKDESDFLDGVDFWTEAPWLSTDAYLARFKRLGEMNDNCQWFELMREESEKRQLADERSELKKLRAEVKQLRAENARLKGKRP